MPLGYSEARKAFTGPRGGVLPNPVCSWLLGKALAQVAGFPARPPDGPPEEHTALFVSRNIYAWSLPPTGNGLPAHATVTATIVDGQLVFTARVNEGPEAGMWLDFAGRHWLVDGRRLPWPVYEWMKRAVTASAGARARSSLTGAPSALACRPGERHQRLPPHGTGWGLGPRARIGSQVCQRWAPLGGNDPRLSDPHLPVGLQWGPSTHRRTACRGSGHGQLHRGILAPTRRLSPAGWPRSDDSGVRRGAGALLAAPGSSRCPFL